MAEPGAVRLLEVLRAHVGDERVLAAIAATPRDRFVPRDLRSRAWDNEPLPIGGGQTISQPLVVASMCAALQLQGDERVLDVGTGSGWHAAVLARLAGEVWSIERDRSLSYAAARHLREAGVHGVRLVVGDGRAGLPAQAPFDAINVAAAPADGSGLTRLEDQLADGGRMVAPVGAAGRQQLVLVERRGRGVRRRTLGGVSFVPLR